MVETVRDFECRTVQRRVCQGQQTACLDSVMDLRPKENTGRRVYEQTMSKRRKCTGKELDSRASSFVFYSKDTGGFTSAFSLCTGESNIRIRDRTLIVGTARRVVIDHLGQQMLLYVDTRD